MEIWHVTSTERHAGRVPGTQQGSIDEILHFEQERERRRYHVYAVQRRSLADIVIWIVCFILILTA